MNPVTGHLGGRASHHAAIGLREQSSAMCGGRNVKPIMYFVGAVFGIVGLLVLVLRTLVMLPAREPFGWQHLPWWEGIMMLIFAIIWIAWAHTTKPDDWQTWVKTHSVERRRLILGVRVGLGAGLVWGLFAAVSAVAIWSASSESAVLMLVDRTIDGSLVGLLFFRIRQSFPARFFARPPVQGAIFAVFVWTLGELLGVLWGFVGLSAIYDTRQLLGLLASLTGTIIFGSPLGYFYQRLVGDLA